MSGTLPLVSGWIELVTGLLILIGLFTGVAAFIASGEMAVAYFMAHAPQQLLAGGEPRRGRGALLLRLPLHGRPRLRDLERGQRADARGTALIRHADNAPGISFHGCLPG